MLFKAITSNSETILSALTLLVAIIASVFALNTFRNEFHGLRHSKKHSTKKDDEDTSVEIADTALFNKQIYYKTIKAAEGVQWLTEPEDAVERQYRLLKAYHEQTLAQSRITMWFSLVFAAIGFAVIVIGVVSGSAAERVIKAGSGTVMDAVASLFFIQSNKARELMASFFDKLRLDRKLDESLKMVKEIPDASLKARVMAALVLSFAEVKADEKTIFPIETAGSSSQAVAAGEG